MAGTEKRHRKAARRAARLVHRALDLSIRAGAAAGEAKAAMLALGHEARDRGNPHGDEGGGCRPGTACAVGGSGVDDGG
jgi:hypothetical protein